MKFKLPPAEVWSWLLGAVGLAFGLYVLATLGTPDIAVQRPAVHRSTVAPPRATGSPTVHVKVPITDLIIQQNSECWTGVPGQVCDDGTRTYS